MASGIATMAGIGLGFASSYPREITLLLFGERWLEIAPIIPWIAGHAAFLSISGWQGRLLDVAGRQKADAMLQILGDVTLIGAIGVLCFLDMSAIGAVAAISTVGVASSALWLVAAYRITGLGLAYAIRYIVILVLASGSMWAAASLAGAVLGPRTGLLLCTAIAVGAVLTVLFVTVSSIQAGGRSIGFTGGHRV
jgi:O-antigen/teichoic acid export membrane protein